MIRPQTKPLPPARRRFPWLLALALGALLVMLAAPASRRLVFTQAKLLTGPPYALISLLKDLGVKEGIPEADTSGIDRAMIAAAERHPNDYQVQIARAIQRAYEQEQAAQNRATPDMRVRNLRALTPRFPNSASLRAQILRYATMIEVRLHRDDGDYLLGGGRRPNWVLPVNPSAPASLAAFDRDAAEGERLDPDNAFFPFMRAAGLFEARRDREALAALHRAAEKTRFEDYCADETMGVIKLREEATGDRSVIGRMAAQAAILFPHYATLRTAARVATYRAVVAEQAGRRLEGLAIRRDLMRAGGLLRAEGRTLIANLVGMAIAAIAMTRPGGVPPLPPGTHLAPETRVREYAAYMEQIGHPEEARRAQAELAAGQQVKAIADKGTPVSVMGGAPLMRLLVWWNADMIVLADAFWLLALAGLMALLARGRFAGGIAPGAAAVAVLVLIAVVAWQSRWAEAAGAFMRVIRALTSDPTAPGPSGFSLPPMALRFLVVGTTLLVPALLIVGSAIAGAIRRKPLSGLLAGTGACLGSLFLLLYVGMALYTLRQETNLYAQMDRMLRHEGRYLAEITGRKWPGLP
jgi:hypothetical protein